MFQPPCMAPTKAIPADTISATPNFTSGIQFIPWGINELKKAKSSKTTSRGKALGSVGRGRGKGKGKAASTGTFMGAMNPASE